MKKILTIIISFTLIIGSLNLFCIRSYADERDFEYLRNLDVIADGKDPINVKYVDLNYDNASYVSLRDMAVALKGTHAEYSLTVNESSVTLTKGGSYTEVGGENEEFTSLVRNKKSPEYTRKRNRFTQNGAAVYYYTIIYKGDDEKNYDCYMYLADLALVLNVDMHYENGALVIDTSKPFTFDPRRLEDEGYFLSTNSVLVGDATTGEIYYSYNPDASVAMASTTKLMTFLLVMDEISKGNLSLDDTVEDFEKIMDELAAYGELAERPQIVAANKMDVPGAEENLERLRAHLKGTDIEVYPISAATHTGLDDLLNAIIRMLPELPAITVFPEEEITDDENRDPFTVQHTDGVFVVSGPLADRLLGSVNFADHDSLNYFHRTLRSRGVIDALRAAGAGEGDTVVMGDMEFDFVE